MFTYSQDIELVKTTSSSKSNSQFSLDGISYCDVTDRGSESKLMSLDKSEMMSEDLKRLMKSLSE